MPLPRLPRTPSAPVVLASARATLLVVLLMLTLGVAGMLAYEAHHAVRSQRMTAERALRDHATFATRDLVARAVGTMDSLVGPVLRPVTGSRALSPYEPLAEPGTIAARAGGTLACSATGGEPPAFALDLGTRAVRVSGAAPEPVARWLRDTVAVHARAVYRPAWSWATILGEGEMRGRAIVYGVRFAEHDVPVAAYGWVTCSSGAVSPLARAAERDTLLAIAAFDAAGVRVAGAPAEGPDPVRGAEATLDRMGGIRLRAALLPSAARGLAVEWPAPSRLPLLIGVLALTAGLAAIALVQLRREHELARLRADFTSSVSHELRTPLAQILLYAETLSLERVRSEGERREATETIVQEARRLMHMVDNVLHFARAERGSHAIHPAALAVAPATRATLATFAPLAAAGGVRLRAALDEGLVASVDAGALRQILLNLLDNAVKYGPPGQTVTVGADADGGRARVWVEDEGPGIPVPERERIWHAFVRVGRDRTAARPGCGIGLAVVRELAELHGGRAWVEGASEEGGARFVVELGAVDPAPVAIPVAGGAIA